MQNQNDTTAISNQKRSKTRVNLTRIVNGCEPTTREKRLDHNIVHFLRRYEPVTNGIIHDWVYIVDDVSRLFEIYGIDHW